MNTFVVKTARLCALIAIVCNGYIAAESAEELASRAPRQSVIPHTSAAYPVADFNLDTIKEHIIKIAECCEMACEQRGCQGQCECAEVLAKLCCVHKQLSEIQHIDKKILHRIKDIDEDIDDLTDIVEACCVTTTNTNSIVDEISSAVDAITVIVDDISSVVDQILIVTEDSSSTIDQVLSIVDQILTEEDACCISIIDIIGDPTDTVSITDVPSPCDFTAIMDSDFNIIEWLKLIYFATCGCAIT